MHVCSKGWRCGFGRRVGAKPRQSGRYGDRPRSPTDTTRQHDGVKDFDAAQAHDVGQAGGVRTNYWA